MAEGIGTFGTLSRDVLEERLMEARRTYRLNMGWVHRDLATRHSAVSCAPRTLALGHGGSSRRPSCAAKNHCGPVTSLTADFLVLAAMRGSSSCLRALWNW